MELPSPRGPLSRSVLERLRGLRPTCATPWPAFDADIEDADHNLALYLLNTAGTCRYRHVDVRAVEHDDVALLHRALLRWFESALDQAVQPVDRHVSPQAYVDHVLSRPRPVRDVSARDWLVHRAPYLLHEADAHSLAMARMDPPVQHVVAEIQAGEYGLGHASTHAEIFESCLDAIDVRPHEAVDESPGLSLARANLPWLFASSIRFRGAALGQLALFELDSVEPCQRLIAAWDAAGLPKAGRRWFDVHAVADVEHERVIRDRVLPMVNRFRPDDADAFRFGIEATWTLANDPSEREASDGFSGERHLVATGNETRPAGL